MATPKSQRIAIWVIAAMMSIGSIGFYFLIIIDNNRQAEERAKFMQQLQDVEEPQPAKALPGYEAEPFEAASVTELVKEDLKEGDGATVPEGATVKVNYMGWLPDGTIFDSSNRSGEPVPVTLSLKSVIEGWQKGVPGMKVGGVRKLVIPADQAYGEAGSPPTIPGSTPLTFILEVTAIEE